MTFSTGWASGINAYLLVLVLGLADRLGSFTEIPDALGRWDVLAVATFLHSMEFIADKIPYIDSTWDAISTAIRPTAGAIIGVLIAGDASSLEQATLAVVGGGTALISHLVKASSRRGSFIARATVVDRPRPGVAVAFGVWWHKLCEGGRNVNAVTAQALSITNAAVDDGFSESLNASAGGTTGGVLTNGGSINLLAAQATNDTAITVSMDSGSAGNKSGVATIDFVSDGAGTSDLGQTLLASQNVQVTGAVYRLADPLLDTTSVTLAARVGDALLSSRQ